VARSKAREAPRQIERLPGWVALLGRKLRDTRKQRRITQAELAARTRISNRTISRLEKGTREEPVNEELIIKVALGLGETPDQVAQWLALAEKPFDPERVERIQSELQAFDERIRKELARLAHMAGEFRSPAEIRETILETVEGMYKPPSEIEDRVFRAVADQYSSRIALLEEMLRDVLRRVERLTESVDRMERGRINTTT